MQKQLFKVHYANNTGTTKTCKELYTRNNNNKNGNLDENKLNIIINKSYKIKKANG